jgi:hypothetical protein
MDLAFGRRMATRLPQKVRSTHLRMAARLLRRLECLVMAARLPPNASNGRSIAFAWHPLVAMGFLLYHFIPCTEGRQLAAWWLCLGFYGCPPPPLRNIAKGSHDLECVEVSEVLKLDGPFA